MAPVVQPIVATGQNVGYSVVGAVALAKVVSVDIDVDEFQCWRLTSSGVSMLASTASPGGVPGAVHACEGTAALWTPSADHLAVFTDGAPWTVEEQTFSGLTIDRLLVAGDHGEVIAADHDGGTIYGLPLSGASTPSWSCSLGTGVLVGAPAAGRWLRHSGTLPDDGLGNPDTSAAQTLDLLDDTGTVLDSVTFTAPAGAWSENSFGVDVDQGASMMCWVQTDPATIVYLGSTSIFGPAFDVEWRPLTFDAGTDTIAWAAAVGSWTPDWVQSFGAAWHPWASAWGGQLLVSFVRNGYG